MRRTRIPVALEEYVEKYAAEAYDDYLDALDDGVESLQRALEALSRARHIKRGWMYRWRLQRAQIVLKRLLDAELDPDVSPKHDWACLGGGGGMEVWGCEQCGLETMPSVFGFLWPDLLRHLPGRLGQRWRCD